MFEGFQRSLDRELGPPAGAEGRPAAREPWIRDWPLLLGLALSAGLIAASTMLGPSQARPAVAAPSKAAGAAGEGVPGEVVDVGNSDLPAQPAPAKKATKQPAPKSKSPSGKPATNAAEPAATAEPESAGATSQSGSPSSSPRKRSGRSAATPAPSGPAKRGRIVNVTGTSAAFNNGPLSYSFSAPTHKPVAGKRWRLSVGVKRSGAPLTGTVKIDILHQGKVVGHVASGKLQGGRFAHDFDWPERSIGHPLTVKTTIVGGGSQQSFLFTVKVTKAG